MLSYRIKLSEAIIVRRHAREMGYSLFIVNADVDETGMFDFVTVELHAAKNVAKGFIETLEQLHVPLILA